MPTNQQPTPPAGITWQAARAIATARLDAMAEQWRAAGIDPAALDGQAAPVACYASQADYSELRPEDRPARVEDHAVIVRACVQEARKRWGFRLVPMTIDKPGMLAWLAAHRLENTAGTRAAYLAHKFQTLSFEP